MPFNKGDFTQQGVAGHVNANLRLNEKRLVSIDLTSDEEAEGCTITGTVTDLLNDKVYGIGSGVSGNIEITENGENINVAQYATATVNVSGGGSFPMCTATIINTDAGGAQTMLNYEDGKLLFTPFEENTTTVCHFLYQYYPVIEDSQYVNVSCDAWNISAEAISNLVNLSFTNGALVVTDPTLDSSITIDAYAFTVQ